LPRLQVERQPRARREAPRLRRFVRETSSNHAPAPVRSGHVNTDISVSLLLEADILVWKTKRVVPFLANVGPRAEISNADKIVAIPAVFYNFGRLLWVQ
jgi:hypothetical protein